MNYFQRQRRARHMLEFAREQSERPERRRQPSCDVCDFEIPQSARLGSDFEYWGEGYERLTICWPCANEPRRV